MLRFFLEPTDLIRNSPNSCGDPLGLSNLDVCGTYLIFYLSCFLFVSALSAFFRLCLQSEFSQVRSAHFTSIILVFLDPKLQFKASSFSSFWNHSNPSSIDRDSNEIKNSFWVVVLGARIPS